jgi:endonuclease YncB( thermonuclease family)
MLRHAVAAFLLFGAVAARPSSADMAGPASVIDGDTIIVAGEHVRLQGIDSPARPAATAPGVRAGRSRDKGPCVPAGRACG